MKHILMQCIDKISTAYKKIFIGLVLIIAIIMPEEIFDAIIELLDLGYEGISFVLEELIQHIFHVNKYFSQSIVFYLWLSAALFGLFYLWQRLPYLFYRFKDYLLSIRLCLVNYWLELTIQRKIIFFTICLAALYLYFTIFI